MLPYTVNISVFWLLAPILYVGIGLENDLAFEENLNLHLIFKPWCSFFVFFWYDAVLDWVLNPGPPALEASTIPLDYQGGGAMVQCLASDNN